jgi:hypothetical protein
MIEKRLIALTQGIAQKITSLIVAHPFPRRGLLGDASRSAKLNAVTSDFSSQ